MIREVTRCGFQCVPKTSFRFCSIQAAKKIDDNEPLKPNTTNRTDPEWTNAKPLSEVPRLSFWFFLRNLLPGGKFAGGQMDIMNEVLYKKYGPIIMFPGTFGRPSMVQLLEPDTFEKLFRNEGQYPNRPTFGTFLYYRQNVRPDVFKDRGGLLTEKGQKWYEFRTISNPLLLKQKNIKYYIPQVNDITDELLDRVAKIRDPQTLEVPANFDRQVHRWVLESLGAIVLNSRLGLLKPNENSARGEELLSYVHDFFRLCYELDFLPSLWKYVETPKFQKLMKVFDGMTNICLEFIETAKQRIESEGNDNDRSILAQLLQKDEHAAVIMAMDMLMAGIDTTSATFLSCFYYLAKNPDKQERLRQEVMEVLPDKDSPVTEITLHSLPYLKACIKETLRLAPPVTGTGRELQADTVLSGYQIPKGQFVVCNSLFVFKREEHFREPDKFLPERWLRSATHPDEACPHARSENPFAYTPFGFGVRMCIGKGLAAMLLETALLKLIKNYKVEWHYPDMKYNYRIVNTPKGDMKFKLIDIGK